MDKVRLGRALGYGTRHMARTLAAVAEAATAPGPAAASPAERTSAGAVPVVPAVEPIVEPPRRRAPTVAAVAQDGGRVKHLKRSVWQPLATFSSALWLRVTGTFFALLAATMGGGAWRQRGDLRAAAGPLAAHHFWLFAAFAALFTYFALSGFVRAHLTERRAANRR